MAKKPRRSAFAKYIENARRITWSKWNGMRSSRKTRRRIICSSYSYLAYIYRLFSATFLLYSSTSQVVISIAFSSFYISVHVSFAAARFDLRTARQMRGIRWRKKMEIILSQRVKSGKLHGFSTHFDMKNGQLNVCREYRLKRAVFVFDIFTIFSSSFAWDSWPLAVFFWVLKCVHIFPRNSLVYLQRLTMRFQWKKECLIHAKNIETNRSTEVACENEFVQPLKWNPAHKHYLFVSIRN